MYNFEKPCSPEEMVLQHHGILGMKWGVRRYQNPDGSLTEAGKKRYGQIGRRAGYREMRKDQKQLEKTITSRLYGQNGQRPYNKISDAEKTVGSMIADKILKEKYGQQFESFSKSQETIAGAKLAGLLLASAGMSVYLTAKGYA